MKWTNDELNAAIQLIDIALKHPSAGGLNVAKVATIITDKLVEIGKQNESAAATSAPSDVPSEGALVPSDK